VATKEFPLALVIKAVDKATGPLRKINANIAKFTAPVRKLGNSFAALSSEAGLPKLMKGFGNVGSAMGKVGRESLALGAKIFAMAGAAGFALFSIVKGAVDAGDKLGEMSARVGLTVDAYASLQHAAGQADIEQEAFNAGMNTFVKNVGQAKAGTGRLLGFLNKVSPTLAKQVKGAKTSEEAISLMTDALTKVEDPAKRAALAQAAFGNTQFGQFFGQGSEAIQKMQAEFMRLTGSQEDFVKNAGDLDDAMKKTEAAFLGLRSAAFGALFPAFTKLSETVTEFVVKNRDGISKWATETGAAIQRWVQGGGIERLVQGFKDFTATASRFVDMIGGIKVALAGIALFMAGPLIVSLVSLIGTLVSLGAAFVALPLAPFIAAAIGIGAAAASIYANWEPLKFFFKDLWGGIVWNFERAWEKVKPIIDAMGGVMGILTNPLGAAIKGGVMLGKHVLGAGTAAPPLGAAKSAPPSPTQSVAPPGLVTVNIANAPPGTRVSTDKNVSTEVNYSVGPSMVGG
jgi:hypothetical protein